MKQIVSEADATAIECERPANKRIMRNKGENNDNEM